MIKKRYLKKIREEIEDFDNEKNLRFFIFGSSIKKEKFGDIDIGVTGKVKDKNIAVLKERFEESTLPFFIDIIDFDNVSKNFKNNVFNNKVLWIKR
uniref:Uncharacterized protein n=1 Tax=candidate division CPR3 bacterium TaxID=2268181 RepID=A0A7C4LZV2_UNCC3